MLNLFTRKKTIDEFDVDERVQRKFYQEKEKIQKEEDEILLQIAEKKEKFQNELVPIYEEKLKQFSRPQFEILAQSFLTEYPLYMKNMGFHFQDGNISEGKRFLGKMIGDFSDAVHNLPGELFSPINPDTFKTELLILIEFFYVYEELQPDYLDSSFTFMKSIFPEGFIADSKV